MSATLNRGPIESSEKLMAARVTASEEKSNVAAYAISRRV
jgi:hypothetical protein